MSTVVPVLPSDPFLLRVLFFVFMVVSGVARAQYSDCLVLTFGKNSAALTPRMNHELEAFCKKAASSPRMRIQVQFRREAGERILPGGSLTEQRAQTVFNWLIRQNLAMKIRGISVEDRTGTPLPGTEGTMDTESVSCCLRESFPGEPAEADPLQPLAGNTHLPSFPPSDTVFSAPGGTLVRIPAGMFGPDGDGDYRYVLTELFHPRELPDHNMSTFTSSGKLITSFRSVTLWADRDDPPVTSPGCVQKQFSILIPCPDSVTPRVLRRMRVFRPSRGSKPFVTWSETKDSITLERYGARTYLMVRTNQFGRIAIGVPERAGRVVNCRMPNLKEMKITVVSVSLGLTAMYRCPEGGVFRFALPSDPGPGAYDLRIRAEGYSRNGKRMILPERSLELPARGDPDADVRFDRKDFVEL